MTVTAKICGINDPEAMRAAISGGSTAIRGRPAITIDAHHRLPVGRAAP